MRIARSMVASVLLAACIFPVTALPADGADPAHERVAAFAQLYGVVRYFYPGDAAQQIDWNRFAIVGVDDVRNAHDRDALQKTLTDLFAPLGPGIDIVADPASFPPALRQADGETLVAWRYLGFPHGNATYSGRRTGRGSPPFVGLLTELDAAPLRGKAIRLRGDIRALDLSTTSGLSMMLRVDGSRGRLAFFGNTDKQQAHDLAWHSYSIDSTVAADAARVVLGFTMTLPQHAENAAEGIRHLALEVRDKKGRWTPVAMPELRAAAHPSSPWHVAGTEQGAKANWQAQGDDGYLVLRPDEVSRTGSASGQQSSFYAPPTAGKQVEFALGAGLKARVAMTLSDAQAKASPDRAAALTALKSRLAALPDSRTTLSRAQNEADVVVAWNVLRHFYPYWDVIHADWNRELPSALGDADRATSRAAQQHVLQRLLAPLQDAHGTVYDPAGGKHGALPLVLAPVEQHWVVVASAAPDQARVGDVVTSLDGVPMPRAAEDAEALASGQPSSRAWKAVQTLAYASIGERHTLGLQHADGSASVQTFAYAEQPAPTMKRPQPLVEIAPDIWYLDIARVDMAMFAANVEKLASARAVIYDLRDYPKDFKVSHAIPAHLLDQPESAKWMHVPRYAGPFDQPDGYTDIGWNIQPAAPHFTSRAIFIANGDTVSQGESVMGYVQDDKLGTIVGSTTRGVDGDITSFAVPSGMQVIFTGMKVTHHDGKSRYHALGTPADVEVHPTIAGVRAGRDEELDAALRLAKAGSAK